MRSPTAELPDVQFVTLPPELEEPYNQEIFQEVVVGVVDVGQEERDVQVAVADQSVPVTGPESPQLVALPSQLHPCTWFASTFQFKQLGWIRARRKLVLVLQACAIFRHHLHTLYQNNMAECHLCSKDNSVLEREADQAIDVHASLLTERIIPKNKLAEKFRLSGKV